MTDTLKVAGLNEKGYGNIPKLVMQDRELSIEAKAIYAYFSSYAGGGVNQAFPRIETICRHLNITERRLRNHRKQLIERGYITIEKNRKTGQFDNNVYVINQEITIQSKQHDGETVARQNSMTNINKVLNINKETNKEIKTIVGQPDIDYSVIVNYLNLKTGRKYLTTTKATQSAIKARVNEGFTTDDFKEVIDKKVYEWIDDKKWQKFLRPETLFGNKFEGYLNQEYVKDEGKKSKSQMQLENIEQIKRELGHSEQRRSIKDVTADSERLLEL